LIAITHGNETPQLERQTLRNRQLVDEFFSLDLHVERLLNLLCKNCDSRFVRSSLWQQVHLISFRIGWGGACEGMQRECAPMRARQRLNGLNFSSRRETDKNSRKFAKKTFSILKWILRRKPVLQASFRVELFQLFFGRI
jgi:hypothetical protein